MSIPPVESRIDHRFAALRAQNRAALVTYLMAGDPDAGTTVALMHALVAGGADVIELGVPFSDP
ncbi:MAG: tryptophan synthase subunit alpha, partial [Candidatus Macondimonas sp.]